MSNVGRRQLFYSSSSQPLWDSVTEELRRADFPLRLWLSEKLPNTRPCFADFRNVIASGCIEPPKGISSNTVGTAFDYLLRYGFGGEDPAESAIIGSAVDERSRGYTRMLGDLSAELMDVAQSWRMETGRKGSPPDALVRGCWVLASFTGLRRSSAFERSGLLSPDVHSDRSLGSIMGEAPASAVDDLRRLCDVAAEVLVPYLETREGPVRHGPSFQAPMAGTADLLKGSTLVEVKATVDRRRRDGTPRYGLDARLLYQVVTYGLLGHSKFGVSEVAIFNARYRHLCTWALSDILHSLAGKPVSVTELSTKLIDFLNDPCDSRVPAKARLAAMQIRDAGEHPAARRRRERFPGRS